jgi:hypothetical protein
MGVDGRHIPAVLPPRKSRYPSYRKLGGHHSRCGRVRKISPPPGFDSRTVQPVASRYTHCDIPTHIALWLYLNITLHTRFTQFLFSHSFSDSICIFISSLSPMRYSSHPSHSLNYSQTRYLKCLSLCRTNEQSNSSIRTE